MLEQNAAMMAVPLKEALEPASCGRIEDAKTELGVAVMGGVAEGGILRKEQVGERCVTTQSLIA